MKRRKQKDNITKEVEDEQEIHTKENIFISTGSTLLDLALSGGSGFKAGTIVNLVGDASSGKSAIGAEVIARGRKTFNESFKWKYDDAESGFTFDTEKMYGFSIERGNEGRSETIEEFGYNVEKKLQSIEEGDVFVYVLDSLDGLPAKAEIDRLEERDKAFEKGKESDTGSYNSEKQRELSAFFRVKAGQIRDNNLLLVIISQVRANIGVMFGAKYKRNGGKALDHHASQIIWLSETEVHEKHDRAIGITVKARITKNKIGKPFRECFIDILFDYGIDDIISNVKFFYKLYTDTGKTQKKVDLEWKGEKYNSVEKLVKRIEEANEEEELRQLVIEEWNRIEELITPKRKEKF